MKTDYSNHWRKTTKSSPPTADDAAMLKMETRDASPSHLLLKIEPFQMFCSHGIHKYETGEFDAGGFKWRLIIDINGGTIGKISNYISACLAISDTKSLPANWEVNAVFSIFLMNQNSGKYHYSSGTRCFIAVKSEWGFPQFISKNVLNDPSNGFLINYGCVFGAEIFIIKNSLSFQSLLLREDFLSTKRKDQDEECSCLEFCMLFLNAMKSKACSSVRRVEDQTNDAHEDHDKIVEILKTREASPTHLLMEVEPFPLLGKQGIYKYETGEFDAGGYKWRLIICPNEDKAGTDSNYISVYLTVSDATSLPANWEVNAVFSIFLFDKLSGNYHYSSVRTRRFLAIKTEWGISKFISKKVLMGPSNGFLIDNKCVFGAEVFILEKSAVSECLSAKATKSAVSECLSAKATADSYKRYWTISNFSKLGNVWTSEKFVALGQTWEVSVYPKGNDYGEGQCLSTYIRLVDSKRVKASFTICVKDQINENHCRAQASHWYFPNPENNRCWGSARFIELATLKDPKNGFIFNDCLLLQIEISEKAIV